MHVTELNQDQFSQLKWNLFYGDDSVDIPWDMMDFIESCDYADMIPDKLVFEIYDGICFVEDDFS